MAESDAIVNVLNLLGKNFTALSEKVTESSEKQNSTFEELNKNLKSIVEVQSAQLKIAKDSEEAAKERQTGINAEKLKNEKAAEKNKIKTTFEGLPGLGKVIKSVNTVIEQNAAIQKGIALIEENPTYQKVLARTTQNTRNIAASMLKFSRRAEKSTTTGIRGSATRGLGKAAGGLGKLVGGIAKFLPNILKFLGPVGVALSVLLPILDKLKGAVGFLITGTFTALGIAIFTVIEMFEDAKKAIKKFTGFFEGMTPDDWWNTIGISASMLAGKVNEYANHIGELFPGLRKYTDGVADVSKEVEEYWSDPPTPNQWWEDTKDGFNIVMQGIGTSISNIFTGISDSIKKKIDETLNFAGNAANSVKKATGKFIGGVKNFIGLDSDKTESTLDPSESALKLSDNPSATVRNAPSDNLKISVQEKLAKEFEELNKSFENNRKLNEESNKQTKQATEELIQGLLLLNRTMQDKDFSTKVINNTITEKSNSIGKGSILRNNIK